MFCCKSHVCEFSALNPISRRLNPSVRFPFALLRFFAPLREAPELAFDHNSPIPKFYPADPQALRNSISRNSLIPQRLEIPRGGGAIFVGRSARPGLGSGTIFTPSAAASSRDRLEFFCQSRRATHKSAPGMTLLSSRPAAQRNNSSACYCLRDFAGLDYPQPVG